MTHTTNRWRRGARAIGGVAAATAAVVALATPAMAAQSGDGGAAQANCIRMGGSWRDGVYGGIEGHGCRIDVFYGCGVDIHYDGNGRPIGGDAWCLGFNIDW